MGSNLTAVVVTSFGYGHGPAPEATVTLDVRSLLRDPHVDPVMRQLTGAHKAVRDRVVSTPGATSLITNTARTVLDLLDDVADPRGELVTVAIGCVGGRHRSVVLAELLAELLRQCGHRVDVRHRDVDRPVLTRTSPVSR